MEPNQNHYYISTNPIFSSFSWLSLQHLSRTSMAGPLRSCTSLTSCIKGWSSWNGLKVLSGMFCPVTKSIAEASCSLGLSYTEGGIEKYDNYSYYSSVTILYTHLCTLFTWKLPLVALLASPVYHQRIQTTLDGCICFILIGINLCSSSKQLPPCMHLHPLQQHLQVQS